MITEITIFLMFAILVFLVFIFMKVKGGDNSKADISSEISRVDHVIREEFSINRTESQKNYKEMREELYKLFTSLEGRFLSDIKVFTEESNKRLEDIKTTVDERLQTTIEKRFNESFKLISDRLEQVHKGLGEMQTLASGVGDLKKVLTNVKTRGILGEIQLGNILEQFLSPEQYDKNVLIKPETNERIEYAVKFPGKDDAPLLLPIDSKFPIEDYQRLIDAYETSLGIEEASKQFENSVKKSAKEIRDKYIAPPKTTDFAIMFLPTEGLYAEILRRTALPEILQRDYKVIAVGPTNLVAMLNSFQMGFKTLAIEKRSSEVWTVLEGVKTEFTKFGDILDKTKKKLQEAANVIDSAGVRSRAIERKLNAVQGLTKGDDTPSLPDEQISSLE